MHGKHPFAIITHRNGYNFNFELTTVIIITG